MVCCWWTTQLIFIVSSQLDEALLVDRVEQKEDHVLVYIQEVRDIQWGTIDEALQICYWSCRLFFFNQLSKDIAINHSLELIQELPVQNLKPAVVKIYDYYQPSKSDTHILSGVNWDQTQWTWMNEHINLWMSFHCFTCSLSVVLILLFPSRWPGWGRIYLPLCYR